MTNEREKERARIQMAMANLVFTFATFIRFLAHEQKQKAVALCEHIYI